MKKSMKEIFKKTVSFERWLQWNEVRQDEIDREIKQTIICYNLPEEEETKLFDFFQV